MTAQPRKPAKATQTVWVERWCPPKPLVTLTPIEKVLNRHTFLVTPELKRRTRFHQVNLTLPVDAALGEFEVIFLRNVMIYFDGPTQRRVLERIHRVLKPGGTLFVGHRSE